MIWIYAAHGLIGQALVSYLADQLSPETLYLVAETNPSAAEVSSAEGISWLQRHAHEVEFCLFLANEKSTWLVQNSQSSQAAFKQIWRQCVQHAIPFLYFSSYETYSPEGQPWHDNELSLSELSPVSPFGQACHALDAWVNQQPKKPYYWASLKLAEVYEMKEGEVRFSSPHLLPSADFPYVPLIHLQDVVQVIWFFMRSRKVSGLFNTTSSEYLVSSSLGKTLDIRRMDRFCSMNHQKLRNVSSALRFRSVVSPVTQDSLLA